METGGPPLKALSYSITDQPPGGAAGLVERAQPMHVAKDAQIVRSKLKYI